MKNKKALSVVFGVLILASLLVSSAAAANSTANSTASEQIPKLVTVSLSLNQSWGPNDYTAKKLGVDMMLIVVANGTGTLKITMESERMNDTMFINATKIGIPPESSSVNATSPDRAEVSFRVLLFAVSIAKMGYLECPSGFPANYSVTLNFTK